MFQCILGELQGGKEELKVPLLGGRVDVDGRHNHRHGQSEADEREADGGAALAAAAPAARAAGAEAAATALTHRSLDDPGNQKVSYSIQEDAKILLNVKFLYMYEIIPCFLRLAHVNPYLTFQKLISDGVDGEYLAESRTQTRRAIETLCSAAVVKLASARHPKPSLPSPQELSQRKSFPPLPLTHSLSFSLLGVLSLPTPPRRSSSWLPFAPVPPSFPSVSDVKKDA